MDDADLGKKREYVEVRDAEKARERQKRYRLRVKQKKMAAAGIPVRRPFEVDDE